jgi:hypothetical protein
MSYNTPERAVLLLWTATLTAIEPRLEQNWNQMQRYSIPERLVSTASITRFTTTAKTRIPDLLSLERLNRILILKADMGIMMHNIQGSF